jgi:hypothetical protein
MRARGRVEAVSSGRTCWFALRRPVPLSDVVLNLWGARGADCLLRTVGGQKFVELLPRDLAERRGSQVVVLLASWSSGSSGVEVVASWSSGSSGSPIVEYFVGPE